MSCYPMLLKPSWSFFNKPVSLRRIQKTPVFLCGEGKQAPHTKTNSYQIFDLIEPSPSSLVCGKCFLCGERITLSAYKGRRRRLNQIEDLIRVGFCMRSLFPFSA